MHSILVVALLISLNLAALLFFGALAVAVFSTNTRAALLALPVMLAQLLTNVTAAAVTFLQLAGRLAQLIDVWSIVGQALAADSLAGSHSPDSAEKNAAKDLRNRVMRGFQVGPAAAKPPVDLAEVRKRNEVEAEGKALS